MKNKERIGQIAMHPGNENIEPCVVYVLGRNGFDMLAIQKLNTGILTMTHPEKETLLDFDFKKYEILRAEWNIEEAKRRVQRSIKNRSELLKEHSRY